MSGVPPPPEGFTLDGAPPADASNRLVGVNGTAPQAGADASTYGPQVGVHPDVALQMPGPVKQAATLRSAQATVAASPSLSSWLAGASNATLANVQDSLPHLAGIGTQVAAFQAAPWASWFAGAQSALTAQEREGMAPHPWWDMLGPGQIRGASDLLQTAGLGIGALENVVEGPFAPSIQAGQDYVSKLLGPKGMSAIQTALLGIMPGEAAAGEFLLRRNTPIDLGTVPSEPAGPRPLGGPPGAVHPAPEARAEYAPSPYVSATTLPPVGAAPEVDALRGATASFDAEHVASIQEAIAQAPVFSRSPEVVQDFIEQTHPGTVASVDPERLAELAQQGHIPFPELGGEILRSAADGSDVEVPLARYLVATAGQPYAAALNAAATFREGGTSVEQAKESGGVAAGGPAAAVEGTGGEVSATGPETSGGVLSSGGIGAQRVGASEGFTPMEQSRLDELQRANVLAAQQAMRASFLTHLVEDPKALGMSKEEFARYSESLATVQSGIVNKMQERALRVVKREREPEFKAAAALHAIPAREGLEALPAVRAMKALSEPGMKLDRDLVQNFYPGNAGRLPSSVLKANANHPDNAAEALGFGSGAELVQALADLHEARTASGAKSLDAYLNLQAHEYGVAKAREQFGYDLSPQANYEAAAELVHAPDVKRFLADELRHLSPAFNEYDVDNYVRVRFEGMTVRLARNTRKLTELAYKNGVKAQRALQEGDVPGAFKFRQAQYIQHQLSAKSIEFQKELRKGQKLIGRIADEVSLPGVDQTHLNWAKDVVATTGRAVTGNPVDLRRPIGGYATLDDFIRAKVNAGGTIIRAPVPIRKAVGNMTVREFGGLSDMLESMLQNGRREGTIDIEGKRQALAEFVASALPRFERYTKTITEEERNSPTFLQKVEAARRGVDAWLVRFSQLMKDFSGGDPRSPFMQMDSQLKAAEGNDRDMRVWTAGHLKALNKTVGKGWQAWLKMRLPTEGAHKFVATTNAGDPVFNTGMDVVMAALHMGDEEALSRYAEGYNSTPQDIENVVHQFATPQMWKFVHGMWDVFAHFKPDIEALYKRETNVTPKMVEPRPFARMEDGVAIHEPGAYFPVMYDTVANPSDFVEALDPEELLGERHYVRATPANGYIKERTGSAGMVQRQLGTVYSRINQVIHDLAYREALANANKFLSHPDIQSVISRKYGPEYVGKLRANLQRIAGAEAGEMTNNAKVARAAAQWMTEGQMVNMIGYSPKTIMKHIGTVIPQAVAEVGPKRFAQAYGDFLANHDARAAQALAESPALRHMVANYSEDGYRQWLALTEKSGISNQIRAFAFHGISNIQRHIGTALYFAAKQRLADRFPGMSEEALRAGANHSVEQVTGSAGLIDTPESLTAGRDVPGAFYRMGNNFLTFLSHMYNRSREIPQNLGYAGDKVDLGRALATLLVNIVLPILIDQEVDKRFGKAIWDIGMWGEGMVHQFISPVPGANTTVAAGMHIATGGEYSTEESAAASFGMQVGNTALDIKHFVEGKSLDNRAVQHALTLAGQVFHLPGAEAARLEGFLHDLTTNSKPVDELVKELLLGPGPQPHTTTHHSGHHA